ncbi:MAG: 4-hydroxybenzoate octaprenyltransferase [Micropepsaceae bacterium]
MSATEEARPADASPVTWVDTHVPASVRPYLRLARADRPIGIWLLLWPSLWSIALASPQAVKELSVSDVGLTAFILKLMVLFALGAAVMRGAGCVYNDIVDRDIDAKVARTAGRPIPSGQVTLQSAWSFLIVLLLIGLLILVSLNNFSIALGAASLIPIAIYPFMKRITDWPQAFLGLTFNWGAMLGWSAVLGGLALAPMLLFFGCFFWTLGYDTIYAHQDKEDDALIGVHSTAQLFGDSTKTWVGGFYLMAWLLLTASGWLAGLGFVYYAGVAAAGAHLAWQVYRLDINDGANCLRLFKSNRDLGLVMFLAIVGGIVSL